MCHKPFLLFSLIIILLFSVFGDQFLTKTKANINNSPPVAVGDSYSGNNARNHLQALLQTIPTLTVIL